MVLEALGRAKSGFYGGEVSSHLRPFNLHEGDREAAGEGDRWESSLGL